MTFEEAVRKAMKVYWNKTADFDELKTSQNRKYNKSYFDNLKSSMLNKEAEEPETKKKKSKGTY